MIMCCGKGPYGGDDPKTEKKEEKRDVPPTKRDTSMKRPPVKR